MLILAISIAAVFIVSLNTGYLKLTPAEVARTLVGLGTHNQNLTLFEFRLPRIVISLLVGAGLAVSGCILQAISRNALADPGLLGINAGAGLMVMLYIALVPAATVSGIGSIFLLPVLALAGAGATACLIYILAYRRHEGIAPTRLILTGIAVAAGISAAMIVMTLRLDPDRYQFVATWLAGSIWGTTWKYVLALLPWTLFLLPYAFFKARMLDALNLGDQIAAGLGTPVESERLKLLATSVGLAASAVAVSGGIGFVGLIGPHLARHLVGPKHQLLLPASALAGALLMIVADTIARWLLQPSEIPTGIIVAVIGAPYFLYLLARAKA
ncbi:FecCD family ABC transporter permease [Paenibacillus senegalensis]|uniref:FecCD family ABC transporter permease n=1 Tax=Paenibacillus senegalensis TaxID=1465766 RepID=UPI0005A5FD18|nr:iron ABC transporter permease [Paenibacillus senegalensis]